MLPSLTRTILLFSDALIISSPTGEVIPANSLNVVGVFDFIASYIFCPVSLLKMSMLMVLSVSTEILGASSFTVVMPIVKGEASAVINRQSMITRERIRYFDTPFLIAYSPPSTTGLISRNTRGFANWGISITAHPSA